MRQAADTAIAAASDKAAPRWLKAQARLGQPWGALAVLAGLVQALATVGQASSLAVLLHALVIAEVKSFSGMSACIVLPVCVLVRALAGALREESAQRASERIRQHLRETLLDRLYQLGPAWRDGRQTGGLAATLLEQVEAVDGYFARYRPQQWLALLVPVIFLLVVLPRSWLAALILLMTAPLIPLFMILVGKGAQARQQQQMLVLQRMSGHFLDGLRGLPTLRLLDAHHRLREELAQIGEEFRIRTMRVLRLAFLSGAVLEFFASVAIALTAVYLGFSLLGRVDFGFYGPRPDLELAFFILLLAPEFYQPLRDLGTHYHARAEALAAAGDLLAMLQTGETGLTGGDSLPGPVAPNIVLKDLCFEYRPGEPVLKNCSLNLAAGEAVAIVGASGGGKTTLLRLLLGQLQATSGSIAVDGLPLSTLNLAAWRENIGWMSQHPRLVSGTLADNLRVARHDADEASLREALAFVGLDDWLSTLPQGLETPLGEGARPLSGGQLRRLALARVWLRPARLLLLDEPTASLDAETETFIVKAIARLRPGHTLILLTHRQAPLVLADRVLELRDSKLFFT